MITHNQIESFKKDGFFIIESQIRETTLKEISVEIDRLHELSKIKSIEEGIYSRIKETNSRFFQWQVHTESVAISELLKHKCYINICKNFVGSDADLFTGLAAVKVANHGESFPWHQDTAYAITDPLESITTWLAIDNATSKNGCLIVIPGSHKKGLLPHKFDNISIATAKISEKDIGNAISLEMVPGQIAVFSSLLLHMTGPNKSKYNRRAIVLQFHKPNVVLARTHETIGDKHPIIRNGRPVNVNPVKGTTGVNQFL